MTIDEIWAKIAKDGPDPGVNYYDNLSSFNVDSLIEAFKNRESFVRTMAWAVPSKKTIERIVQFTNSILEVGAGLGLWAFLLKNAGVTVTATDLYSRRANYVDPNSVNFTEVIDMAGMEAVKAHGLRHDTLMLCWPPYSDPLAYEALMAFAGQKLVYIGECGGCTADENFAKLIESDFTLEDSLHIPQWYGLHDELFLYKRVSENPMRRKISFE